MTEHKTFPGKVYAVTCRTGCILTDDNGMNETVEAGKQFRFMAQSSVVYTSEPATVTGGNFKLAPAELLGLLGGGVSAALPSGYLAAEFLESTGEQHIDTGRKVTSTSGAYAVSAPIYTGGYMAIAVRSVTGVQETRFFTPRYRVDVGAVGWGWGKFYDQTNTNPKAPIVSPTPTKIGVWQHQKINYRNNAKAEIESSELKHYEMQLTPLPYEPGENTIFICAMNYGNGEINYRYAQRIALAELTEGEDVVFTAVPCVNKAGVPCMYERKTRQPFTNDGTGQFIVGFTLEQARKLGKHLPTGGGALTISLPTGYERDAAVTESLEAARANGWMLTIQTYTPEAAASSASTYGMRRIWVRKRADEQGSYVDTDGFRWQVDWCVDVVGSSPEAEGYEPFRSVDVAVNYWGLMPWVYPEQEEEFLTNTEEV